MALPLILAGAAVATFAAKVALAKRVEPAIGSVVYADMGPVEHSGIYVGGYVVSLSSDGKVVRESKKQFVDGFKGPWIYVSCSGGEAVGDEAAASRARQMVGRELDYGFIQSNCHNFASGCLTGDFNDPDKGAIFLFELKMHAEEILGADSWGIWR